ncbi:50S ribosomal protein L17 [Candidatus Peregrinibacteria bacterium]|nr:50S ribosomal protein L17 [Candidatus Peregrinibacteria bacterium]
MRHLVKNKRISRNSPQTRAMLRTMAASLVLHEKIETTLPKAKLLKAYFERLMDRARKAKTPLNAHRTLNIELFDPRASYKMVEELLVRFKDRKSGYVRITHLGFRPGDAAIKAQIAFV